MFLELKRPGGKATPLQRKMMATIAARGGAPCVVAHSVEEALAAVELWQSGAAAEGLRAAIERYSQGEWFWSENEK